MSRYLELCTLGDLLVRGSEHHPERDALVLPGVRRSYRELTGRATRVARSLTALGVTRGDHVGLFMPNGPEFIEAMFGIFFTGAVAVLVNARFTARELGHVVRDAGLKVLLAGDAPGEPRTRADIITEALSPDQTMVVAAGTALRPTGAMLSQEAFGQLADGVPADEMEARRQRVALRDPAIMFYTSGTTAMPKGCVLSHEAQARTGVATRFRLGYADGDRVFAPCPMFHTASTQPMVATLHAFGTFVTMGHFEPGPALELIEAERVTHMFPAFPPLTLGLLNSPGYSAGSFASVRTVFTVAPPEALRAMQRRMPHSVVVNAYGMTEFGGSVVMVGPADDDDARLATQGPPFPGLEIGIRDASGQAVPPGGRGEIVIRGPSMFERYHNDPGKTAETIDADGWYHSGDLGTVGDDGRLRYLGRLKDMLKVGGENVAAIEIASHLQAHPAVSVAQVVGVADEKYGEVAAAFIEVSPGAVLTEEEVIAHCRAGLASFKVPRHVRFVTEWPMSSTKVQTFRLREQLEAELAAPPDAMMVVMAIVHNTTMTPTKLELLAAWLPAQPWYAGAGREPELTRVGGFRLDDPLGEVGIEFMLVADGSAVYQVPMTYRARELPGAGGRLIGTSEHGVLGQRWIYDGTRDPVLVAQLVAFIQGEVEAQAQHVSSTPDPTVTSQPVTSGSLAAISSGVGADGLAGTELLVETAGPDGLAGGQLTIRIRRTLEAETGGVPAGDAVGQPCLSGTWRLADGTQARGVLATARHSPC